MSTIGYESWAVDLKDVGAIYPFQGYELPMVLAGVAFWVIWHIWQIRFEDAELKATGVDADAKKANEAIDRF
ncbi:MAG: hypothetical protein AB7S70_14840 [Hyphomicrobium sp.]|uniref:hypothetical protein n=1 Tax=Hyphomicrobium sp. TaxID=82 RepID=UPI003D0FE2B5